MKKNAQRGFTLIELLIAAVLLLILIGPLFSFLRVGQANRSTTIRTTDIEQNARGAMITMGRDITNAGFNFAPQVRLGTASLFNNLSGPADMNGVYLLTPLIPGNNLNQVRVGVDSGGTPVFNTTDQITLVSVDPSFNNGLPLTGTYNATGASATLTVAAGMLNGLFVGDLLYLNRSTVSAIGVITGIDPVNRIITLANSDPYQINRFGNIVPPPDNINQPLTDLSLPIQGIPVQPPILAYRFSFLTFFVDVDGNLIRRELLPPPHTTAGGNNVTTVAQVTPNGSTYNCNGTCYFDNIIATGIEDLQFTYNINDPNINVAIDDPGFNGRATNGGADPEYRLNDIREVNVSLKVRAADRDNRIKVTSPTELDRGKGYLYRFTLEGTFGVRNIFRTNFINVPAPPTNP
ncbi:MAG: prepilin-type N-terminal cleavage/methylation domain-containing protein [Acidobacteria bacterium]|nr:prepilin-type N-terminal cleavage/methylation domain-containing protein [Acidobacteriota bacterium]